MKHEIRLSIPEDLAAEADTLIAPDTESRLTAVIRWSQQNVDRGEGPFAAGVFRLDTGQCVGAGVNRVFSSGHSIAHAEIMAILIAQAQRNGALSAEDVPLVITSSAQPCSQCMGAIPWTEIRRLEYGADREAVEALGFDEGPCPENWKSEYTKRGIDVIGPGLKEQAVAVLKSYAEQNGTIY